MSRIGATAPHGPRRRAKRALHSTRSTTCTAPRWASRSPTRCSTTYSAMLSRSGTGPGRQRVQRGVQPKFQQAEAALLDTIAFVPAEYDNYVFLSNLYNVAGQMIDPSLLREGRRDRRQGRRGRAVRAGAPGAARASARCAGPDRRGAQGRRVRGRRWTRPTRRRRCCSPRSIEDRAARTRRSDCSRRFRAQVRGQAGVAEADQRARGERLRRPRPRRRRRRGTACDSIRRHDAATPRPRGAAPAETAATPRCSRPAARDGELVPTWLAVARARAAARGRAGGRLRHPRASHARPAAPYSPQEIEIRTWTAASRGEPQRPQAHLGLGYAYQSDGRYDKALEQYEIVLKSDPQDTAALYNRGNDLSSSSASDERAEKSMWEVLDVDPTHVLAAKALGEYYAAQGRVQVADRGGQARGRGASGAGRPAVPARPGVREARRRRRGGRATTGAALKYAPDLTEAQEGLKRVGAGK